MATHQTSWQHCRASEHTLAVLWHAAFGDGWNTRLDCGHQPTVSAAEVLTARETWFLDEEAACANASDPAGLARWLCGRVIMIGSLSFIQPDFVVPDTSMPLPAVYWHAMALDNLLAFGDDYKRDEHELVPGLAISSTLLALGVFLVMASVALAIGFLRHRHSRQRKQQELGMLTHIISAWSYNLVFVVIHFIAAYSVAWFAFVHLNLAPINWIGIFATGVVLPPLLLSLSR